MHIIQVCIGSACHLKGSYKIIKNMQEVIQKRGLENEIDLRGAFCIGECTKAVAVKIDDNPAISVSENQVETIIENLIKE
ncbi:(2Fe-2S) ferredoxin domain-containing protein [Irregularibacter muris]|uniref:(2Fe-2S) ferredoxin domain-containing protein n=1 Tax=Irregularibacter muris TaxID=1796619 RepID=A0AAE3HEK8_9FIRM|nr:(2Fe-2S) ferredoxin domain-containing protein [Irregularibacter muris]MCR1897703.1 (2Fe-2S) ferredoxin domain-containing protein [Irregularibacter muris]